MNLIVTADYHGEVEAALGVVRYFEEKHLDAIIVSGDITHAGTAEDAEYLLNTLLDATPNVLYVSGNFDPPEISNGVDGSGAFCLHGRSHMIGEYTFVGVSGAVPAPFWSPFTTSDKEIEAALNKALSSTTSRDKLILVSHDPPNSTSLDKTTIGTNVGSKSVKEFILREKPILASCGHIHEAAGVEKINSTVAVNPGPAFTRRAAIVSLEPEVTVELVKI
ncbi:MAG: metallophosphoesterase family protein [Promethearchaeati archaeon SRVP18_Atabeyarchaeia-1]